ncbi:hypothetical protein ACSYAD_32860, partial [Acaryochloris marina NIES-2412]|uniref:hypothetical protein n=1 Tax=Acaryochloris marina TaxID=155978 RepID=UPI004057EFE0
STNHNAHITKQSSKSPILGIEALLGLVALKVKLQNSSSFFETKKNHGNKEDQDGEICLTRVPPRLDNQREVDDLATTTVRESQTPVVADQPIVRTVLDSQICTRKKSTSGGSS